MLIKDLDIIKPILRAVEEAGYEQPTEIQENSIPVVLKGKDILGCAQTGTGKTAAFAIPILQNIVRDKEKNDERNIKALIVAPTRELAIQIEENFAMYSKYLDIKDTVIFGGVNQSSQVRKIKAGVDVLIATPGRLLDHLDRGTIDLSNIKTFVLDEADQMLLMGFRNEIDLIMKETPKKKQTLCFSATMDSAVKKLAYRYMNDPIIVSVKKEEITLANINQEVVETIDREKREALCKVLDEDNPFMAIIFCRTKRRADELEVVMHRRGYNCKVIHSDIQQSKRERIMKSFRNADIQYLIATDVASRGLDIGGVDHIYNYDIPENVETYIHRIGRTGRAGEKGYTCLFVDPKDSRMLSEIEKSIKLNIPRRNL